MTPIQQRLRSSGSRRHAQTVGILQRVDARAEEAVLRHGLCTPFERSPWSSRSSAINCTLNSAPSATLMRVVVGVEGDRRIGDLGQEPGVAGVEGGEGAVSSAVEENLVAVGVRPDQVGKRRDVVPMAGERSSATAAASAVAAGARAPSSASWSCSAGVVRDRLPGRGIEAGDGPEQVSPRADRLAGVQPVLHLEVVHVASGAEPRVHRRIAVGGGLRGGVVARRPVPGGAREHGALRRMRAPRAAGLVAPGVALHAEIALERAVRDGKAELPVVLAVVRVVADGAGDTQVGVRGGGIALEVIGGHPPGPERRTALVAGGAALAMIRDEAPILLVDQGRAWPEVRHSSTKG